MDPQRAQVISHWIVVGCTGVMVFVLLYALVVGKVPTKGGMVDRRTARSSYWVAISTLAFATSLLVRILIGR